MLSLCHVSIFKKLLRKTYIFLTFFVSSPLTSVVIIIRTEVHAVIIVIDVSKTFSNPEEYMWIG